MDAESTKYLCELLAPRFVLVRGKIFVNVRAIDLRRIYKTRAPRTVDENTSNHVHFDFFPGNTEAGIRDNYALADATRIVWRDQLRRQCPRKRFRLFVSNEYYASPSSRRPIRPVGERVQSILRLWSIPTSGSGFDATYHPDSTGPDWVLWPEYRGDRLVRLSRVLELIRTKDMHPAKVRYLRERWNAI
jgi:hypothetical protein